MLTIDSKPRDLGGFHVARLLPHHSRRMVGPFIFFDHIGPARMEPGTGMDVRPHPHIGLATVTYLFDGAIRHKDTLGTVRDIGPGAVNWMTAGRGIAHSERTPPELRASGHLLHGIQTWVALPKAHEETAPAFVHHPADTIPDVALAGASARVIAGEMWGVKSPVEFPHPIIYAELKMEAGARVRMEALWGERAVFVVSGEVFIGGETLMAGQMRVLEDDTEPMLEASGDAHLMICGGAPMDGPRLIWWNLVATEQGLIDAAKADWAADPTGGRWGHVPDEVEFIPLPE
ncbi:pirin family protein [Sandaracinobacteroides hominis]|uniref:pirin family protein n=1 Tax=Sandaracinobacteroides hominis TaxID=2780086 RepID=UPI0018F7891B|nr:pirin family protein [Sandaracinobacteroides hominis]